ncbi:MAG: flippase [Patescibacteria group bacterium]
MTGMSTTRALAWNTGVQIFGKIVSTAIGVVIIGIMTRYLGDIGFGMYSTANAYFQVFAILLDLGLNVMLVQMLGERAGDKAYEDRAVSATFTFRIITALILLSIAPVIALAFPSYPLELKIAIFVIWGSFFFSSLNQIVIGVQQRHLKMHVVAIAEVAGRLTLLGGLFIAIYLGWGLIPIVGLVSAAGLVNFAVNAWVARRYASFRWNWDPTFWKELLRRAWPIGLSILFNLIYFKADTVILSFTRPFQEVGIYSAAYRVLEILITLPFMYCGVLLPLIAKAWASKNIAQFQSLIKHSYVVMILLVAPMVAGVVILGKHIMTAVAGADFAQSGDVLKILMLAVAIIFIGTLSSHAIVAVDAQRKMIWVYIGTAVVTLAGYLLFIPSYGMWAAAWLTVFSETLVAIGATWITLRTSNTSILWSPILKCIAAAIVMGFAIVPLENLWLPIPILAGGGIYIALILLTGAVDKETLRELLTFRKGASTVDVI